LAAALALTIAAHADSLLAMMAIWDNNATYQYGWVVMPVFLYLLWHRRGDFTGAAPATNPWAIPAALVAAGAWLAADLLNIAEGRQFALIAMVWALTLAALGWTVFTRALPMLALLLFLVPSGGFLTIPLRHLTVEMLATFPRVFGIPFRIEGFAVFVESNRYVVINDCAGLHYLLMALFLGLVLALLIYRRWWKIAALTLFSGALAIVANGLRVVGIAAWDYITGSQMELSGHVYFDWLSLGLLFITLLAVFAYLKKEAFTGPTEVRRSRFPRLAILVPTTLVVVSAPLLLPSPGEAIPLTASPTLPETVNGWRRTTPSADWHPAISGEHINSTLAGYRKDSRSLSVFVGETADARTKISAGADLGMHGGWMPGTSRERHVCDNHGCEQVRHIRLLLQKSQRVRHLYVTYAVAGSTASSQAGIRLRRAWTKLLGGAPEARLIALAVDSAEGLEEPEITALLRSLKPVD
jgi:exosortase